MAQKMKAEDFVQGMVVKAKLGPRRFKVGVVWGVEYGNGRGPEVMVEFGDLHLGFLPHELKVVEKV